MTNKQGVNFYMQNNPCKYDTFYIHQHINKEYQNNTILSWNGEIGKLLKYKIE